MCTIATGSICQTNACRVIRLPTAVIGLSKVQARSGDRSLSVPEMGMCPGKSRQTWKSAKPQCSAREKSGYHHIPLKSPPKNPLQERKGEKRDRQNKTGEPANNHKAPWPYVTNKGRERRHNVRQVVLMKGITVLSAVHFTDC